MIYRYLTESSNNFKQIPITKDSIEKYKKQYKALSHIRLNNNTNGVILVDKEDNVVGVINTEKKDDGVWIQGFQIFGKYKGTGLSNYFLKIATNKYKATKLGVRATNDIAIHIYKKFGFKEYDRPNKDTIFMKLGK